ncbi:hypothetical protein ANN_26661 [Periplaneta americana]|uniref:Uncharacterized protein n=1 Tax=Periplaneta americana TaxID=6978 RepID=A0ABQ8RYX5_PERAM|nr:hypothetical protein ANN_26661 [Periplaneta americana]
MAGLCEGGNEPSGSLKASKHRIELAVRKAVAEYNSGLYRMVVQLQKESGLSPGRNTIDIARRRDERRTNLYMIRTTENIRSIAKLRVEQKKTEKEDKFSGGEIVPIRISRRGHLQDVIYRTSLKFSNGTQEDLHRAKKPNYKQS